MRVAVFDLDGTLADTSGDMIAAANVALGEAGFGAPLDAARDRAVAFAGGRAMLREGSSRCGGADERDLDAMQGRFLVHYEAAIMRTTCLFDGAEAALDRLRADGWQLSVCTNKPSALAAIVLERLGIAHRFAAMLGADSLAVRKPDPRHLLEAIARAGGTPERAILIGDTITDQRAADAADVRCVLVGFGPEAGGVAAFGPAAIFDRYADLPDLLERLVPRLPVTA